MNSLVITRTGTHLTIQDFGRFHYQHLGVSPSGAMDQRIIKELEKIIPLHHNQFIEFAYVGPSIKVKEGSVKVCVGQGIPETESGLPLVDGHSSTG